MTASGQQKNIIIINLKFDENETSNLVISSFMASEKIIDFIIYGNQNFYQNIEIPEKAKYFAYIDS
jgi:hypothetical protein